MRSRHVLVIGAGPAGLAAARAALRLGAAVTLLDAAGQTGGQYYRHLTETGAGTAVAPREHLLHHGWQQYTAHRDELLAAQLCTVVTDAHVWAIEREDNGSTAVHVVLGETDAGSRRSRVYRPDALVLATGAHDRTLPFPGWELPGVYTAGAAQALAKAERLAVGRRVVVAGTGPFLLPVAQTLQRTGAQVRAVYEASRAARLATGWLASPRLYWRSRAKLAEMAGYLRTHVAHRIPYLPGRAVVAAHGADHVSAVTVASLDDRWAPIPGTERTVDVDAVCVTHGFVPRLELAVAAGCEIATPPAGPHFRHVRVDARQRTSVPGIWAAGEITGVGGADLAATEGTVAGHCAAGGALADLVPGTVRRRETYREFAARMHSAHAIQPGWTDWLTPETVVCRCENVSYDRLGAAIADTATAGLRSLRLTARAGLGICQARICGHTVEELFMRGSHTPRAGKLAHDASSERRPIAVPVRVGELAADAVDDDSCERGT